MSYRYFSSVHGHAVRRAGRPTFLGATKTKEGFVWDEAEVVRVPLEETRGHHKSYAMALRNGALRERTQADYDRYQAEVNGEIKAALRGAEVALSTAEPGATRVVPGPAKAADVDSPEREGPQGSERRETKRRRKQES